MDKTHMTSRRAERELPGAATNRADTGKVTEKRVEADVRSLNNNPRCTEGPGR